MNHIDYHKLLYTQCDTFVWNLSFKPNVQNVIIGQLESTSLNHQLQPSGVSNSGGRDIDNSVSVKTSTSGNIRKSVDILVIAHH